MSISSRATLLENITGSTIPQPSLRESHRAIGLSITLKRSVHESFQLRPGRGPFQLGACRRLRRTARSDPGAQYKNRPPTHSLMSSCLKRRLLEQDIGVAF